MKIEENGGQSVISENLQCEHKKSGRRLQPHVAAVFSDGTAEGGLGEVLHGARKLGGQALATDWSKNDRISGIKGPRVSHFWSMKLAAMFEVLGRLVKGLLILASRKRILKHLVRFGA